MWTKIRDRLYRMCDILELLMGVAVIIGIGIAVIQAYFYDEINYRVYFKMFWRFLFLLLIVFYLFLLILVII